MPAPRPRGREVPVRPLRGRPDEQQARDRDRGDHTEVAPEGWEPAHSGVAKGTAQRGNRDRTKPLTFPAPPPGTAPFDDAPPPPPPRADPVPPDPTREMPRPER
jgi:hypothetical protein